MSKKQVRNNQPAKPAGMKKMEHRGYVIVQSPRNNHVMIGKDGRTVYHASYDRPMTDDELRQTIDTYVDTLSGLVQQNRKKPARKGAAK